MENKKTKLPKKINDFKKNKVEKKVVKPTKKSLVNKNQKTTSKKKKEVKKVVVSKTKNISKKQQEIVYYSCIFRYYLDKSKQKKKIWIVIGDGHKWYRKFNTQKEAIDYFRNLKKIAKMRVQSSQSKEFIKIISTLLGLKEKGININLIKNNKQIKENNSEEFIDEFSYYDEDENIEELNYSHKEVDKILREKEDNIIFENTNENDLYEELRELDKDVDFYYSLNNNSKFEKSKIIDVNLIKNDENKKTESSTYVNKKTKYNSIEIKKSDLIKNKDINDKIIDNYINDNEDKEIIYLNENKNVYVESDEEIIYLNTLDNLVNKNEKNVDVNNEIKLSSKKKNIIYWSVVVLVCILLATVLAIAIIFVTKN